MQSQKVTLEFLKQHLWKAADILRGSLDASEYRQPVMTILFLKRLNDRFEENVENLIKQGKSEKEANQEFRHDFFVPKKARWSELSVIRSKVGEKIDEVCKIIEKANPKLEGVLTNTRYSDPRKYPDDRLANLISHFNQPRLRNSDLEKEDIFGDAYEYLLEQFADATKKKGGEFFTPREVVKLLVNLVEPKEGMKICDPTCGSGGMLIVSRRYVEKHGGDPRNLVLDGQESNYGNLAMCKMNMVLHGITDFIIEYGDSLSTPKLLDGGKLKTYDRVLANFPFSMNWDNKVTEKDPYNRFRFGIPPAKDKADFAFIQHMFSQLNKNGQAAIICSQGVLFRGNEEAKIRQGMIKEDVIEGIIAIPQKLFFGTGIPACVLVLNRNKPEKRKNKIIFIYAAKDYLEGKNRNKLRDEDITKIVSAFKEYKDVDRYCHVADLEELKENEFNLNVPRYVDISEPEEEVDIQATIDELKKLEKKREELEVKVQQDLKELLNEGLEEMQVQKARKGYKLVKSLFGKYEEIPEDWDYTVLENLTPHKDKSTIRMGPFGSSLKTHELLDSGKIKTLWIENIVNDEFSFEYQKFITEEKYEQLKGFTVKPGDVLITMMGTLGKVAIVPRNIGTAIISSHLLKITLDHKKTTPIFLYYFLKSNFVLRQIIKESRGLVMGGLNTGIIKNMMIKTPPLQEQQKIASILSNIDSQIQKQQEYKSKLETLKKGLMQKLLTGQIRVKF